MLVTYIAPIAKYQQPRLVRVALVVELELVVVEIVAPADFAVGVEIGVVVAAVELETFVVVEGGPS